MKIGTKLTLSITLLISIAIAVISTIIGLHLQKMAEHDAQLIAKETAYHYANIVRAELEVALDEAKALAMVFETKAAGDLKLDRSQANNILKRFIENRPKFLGIYLAFEPNAFDGNDGKFIKAPGHDDAGRFIPYWTRDKKGKGVVEPLVDTTDDEHDDHQLHKKRKTVIESHTHLRKTVIEPHTHIIQNKQVLTSSVVVPFFGKQKQLIGVVGIGFALEDLQQRIGELKISEFKNAYATVYSAHGTVIFSKNASYTGKTVKETTESQALIEHVSKTTENFFIKRNSKTLGTTVMTYGALIKIGNTDTHWIVTVNIPEEELTAHLRKITYMIVFIGIAVALLITVFVIFFFAKTISMPLNKLVYISEAIAAGNLNNEIRWRRQDEIGRLLQTFERMQTQLRERIAEEKRIADEALRINEALDNVTTSVLIADTNSTIIYANQSAQQLFKQAAFCKEMPQFQANNLLGTSIETFFKKTEPGRELFTTGMVTNTIASSDSVRFQADTTTSHQTLVTLSDLKLEVSITPVINAEGERLGFVTELRDRTAEMATEHEVNAVVSAASSGDFSQRIDITNKTGFFKTFSEGLNQTLDNTQQMIEELQQVFAALASGDLSQTITKNYVGSLEQLKNDVNATINKLTVVMSEIQKAAQAASSGDFSQRLDLSDKQGFFKTLSERLNRILDTFGQMIEELKQVFAALATGDLTQTITRNYAGSLEQLKDDVNTTVTALTYMINTVQQSADVVAQAAAEISLGNTNLSQRTEEQAASLEQMVASMEQMTTTVQQNADNAQQANQLAASARDYAGQGGKVVFAAIAAMSEISKSSKQVADIISVIDEIAFQTNLLALNAAVEAARAGEQGRGFAVVATEVRSLAQRSAAAAKEIKGLIQDSVSKVQEGTCLVNQSGTTLEEILVAAKKVNDIVSEIAAASREQTAGIQQINKVAAQLDDMTQQNSALVEEAAVASETLKEQAQSLKEHVTFFNTGEEMKPEAVSYQKTVTASKPLPKERANKSVKPTPGKRHQYDDEWKDF